MYSPALSVLFHLQAVQITLCLCNNNATQCNHSNQVGDAIRLLKISAIVHTAFTVMKEPIKIARI